MYEIKVIDSFSSKQLAKLKHAKAKVTDTAHPHGIMVRSSVVPDDLLTEALLVISRSGVGVNTINVEAATEKGIAVLNTPGVNANAVKEAVLSSLFATFRPIGPAADMVQTLSGADLLKQAEDKRDAFVGRELQGKVIGIVGLGSIGSQVARSCYDLGMEVLGYARSDKDLDYVEQLELEELLRQSDFVVLTLPLTEETKGILSKEQLALMKQGAYLLNFGRGPLVDNEAIVGALATDQIAGYITDFPEEALLGNDKITLLPHIGGNTQEALEGGERLARKALSDFLLYGTVRDSVNFPGARQLFHSPYRVTVFYEETMDTLAEIIQLFNQYNLRMGDMTSNRKNGYVYVLIDLEEGLDKIEGAVQEIQKIPTVQRVRILKRPHYKKSRGRKNKKVRIMTKQDEQ
ncbi:NAD(P)-dependent oxidoreductase [Marinilactibacillus kalidii]|uniref:NAD(P)-dependent oxidoreductase n=1 Tax=Marinilactibacillus kalidii TaxID=2820274 RepID=UPI001ABDF108|nr:NAD(P)-dependent oxidoreductase [Marinilactibacillus kalidii]